MPGMQQPLNLPAQLLGKNALADQIMLEVTHQSVDALYLQLDLLKQVSSAD